MARCAAVGVALLGLLLPGPAWAQAVQPSSGGPFRPWSIEVDAGVLWSSGIDFGSTTASITANQTPAADYPLFETAADLDAAPGFEGRIGLRITRTIGVEGAFQYSRPTLETRISGDARLYFREGGYDLEADEPLRRYFAGGASFIVAF